MNKRGFTLIEILVAISILSILALILLPALGRARESAKGAQCASNLRQIGIGWFLYLDDHEEIFPSPDECNFATFGGKAGSMGLFKKPAAERVLNRYLDIDVTKMEKPGKGKGKKGDGAEEDPGLEVFHCPGDKPGFTPEEGPGEGPEEGPGGKISWFDRAGNSYRFNDYLSSLSLSQIMSPRSNLVLTMDFWWGGREIVFHYNSEEYKNILFMDGHVKMHRLGEIDTDPADGNDPTKSVYFGP